MNERSQGKRILITGGTQGVGEAIARRISAGFASEIVIVGRDSEKGQRAAEALSSTNCRVSFQPCDLGNSDEVDELFSSALEKLGTIDGLVNAAAITTRAAVADGTLDDWENLFAINARAPFFLMQALINHARARGCAASIVNVLSMNAYCGRPNLAIYAATKAALMTLTRNAANAHMSENIRVNGIAMGWAATPAETVVQTTIENRGEDWISRAGDNLPLGRLLTVEEVAETANFLLGDHSGLLTGNIIDLEQWVRGAPPSR